MPKMTNPGENLIGLLVTAIKSIGIVYKCAICPASRAASAGGRGTHDKDTEGAHALSSTPLRNRNALLHPQLLVPVALAAGCSQWNQLDLGPDVLYFDVLIVRLREDTCFVSVVPATPPPVVNRTVGHASAVSLSELRPVRCAGVLHVQARRA